MAKKMKMPPPGLDYLPVIGATDNLSFGIVQAEPVGGGAQVTAESAVFKRMYPVLRPEDPKAAWINPTCFMHSVQLPPGASDELWSAQRLARAYDEQGYQLRDVIVIVTLRFPEAEVIPPALRLHEAWQTSQDFVRQRIVSEHGVAAISVMHVPARAARPGSPHVHVMVPARELLPSGFGKFARPLGTDEGRAIMDFEWASWRRENGLG